MAKIFESNAEEKKRQENTKWLTIQARDYQEVFDLPKREWCGKKILDVGANDRRLAAACAITGINAEVYSLDPAYDRQQEEYADESMLRGVVELLPQEIQDTINKRTVSTTGEETGFADDMFDWVIARSVNYETIDQLVARIRELLRVGKEVRFYPIDDENRPQYEEALALVKSEMPLHIEEKLTLDCHLRTESGMRHVKESVLIMHKR